MSDDLRAAWQRATSIGDEMARQQATPVSQTNTVEARIEMLLDELARLHTRDERIARLLATFYRAPVSLSSLQPVLDLAVELNPGIDVPR